MVTSWTGVQRCVNYIVCSDTGKLGVVLRWRVCDWDCRRVVVIRRARVDVMVCGLSRGDGG